MTSLGGRLTFAAPRFSRVVAAAAVGPASAASESQAESVSATYKIR